MRKWAVLEEGPGHVKEPSSAQARAGSRVGSCGHMTLPRYLDGGFPGALVGFCPLSPKGVALGPDFCLGRQ